MSNNLTDSEKADAIHSLQRYFSEELDSELSDMQAGFMLDYLVKEFGPFAYNRGVEDARSFFATKMEDLGGICFEQGLTHWGDSGSVRRKPN